MICSVSISAFAVEASSETANENTETVQSGSAEEAEELTAAEAENDQSVDGSQLEEPVVTTGDENTEEPTDVIEAPSDDPEQPEEPSVEPGEDNEQPADPTVTEQPEEPTVTEQPEEPAATPAEDADASADEVQDVEMEVQSAKWLWQTTAPKPTTVSTETKAAIYYLSSPDGVPGSNDTDYWSPESDQSKLLGEIDVTNATWKNNKNVVSNVSNYITKWPDGTTSSSWTVRRTDNEIKVDNKTYFNYILDSIWEAYKKNVREKLQVTDLTEDDVTEITLVPFKISRDNSTTENQYYHIDCTINIKCSKVFAAKFWVKEPESNDYKLVDAANYKKDSSVNKTSIVQIGSTREIDGITYILDGWYPEKDPNGNDNNSKISNEKWPYSPNETELADGTVNFYAHYAPLYTSVDIKKNVTGNMGDKSKKFNFIISVVNGNTNLPFKIGETQYTGSTTITLSDKQTTRLTQVPVGATVTITEDDYYSNDRYTPSYTIDDNPSVSNNREAKITSISRRDNDVSHEVTFTNNKDAIPDTGLDLNTTPYILALGIVAAGAGVLLFRRRKRWN
ncbi:DUF7601 domain-containing protein [Blautia massiliensis (ex Durand et al. 2017)]|uniref:DUF7601 domain-containing protein n=1 Tax=Blautia massiliensis (ex Durand et al. 2017) TaxID=1737424 RepID=UPI00156EDB0F|nr:DUF5979 domain-containing protein [Blautia massiliensis (ex Durand et al. 2017)]NSK76561.1 LPXTG cell wall anchor domain-containing protein [Blautia massiliensis (ex Durand et al. 2017)]